MRRTKEVMSLPLLLLIHIHPHRCNSHSPSIWLVTRGYQPSLHRFGSCSEKTKGGESMFLNCDLCSIDNGILLNGYNVRGLSVLLAHLLSSLVSHLPQLLAVLPGSTKHVCPPCYPFHRVAELCYLCSRHARKCLGKVLPTRTLPSPPLFPSNIPLGKTLYHPFHRGFIFLQNNFPSLQHRIGLYKNLPRRLLL